MTIQPFFAFSADPTPNSLGKALIAELQKPSREDINVAQCVSLIEQGADLTLMAPQKLGSLSFKSIQVDAMMIACEIGLHKVVKAGVDKGYRFITTASGDNVFQTAIAGYQNFVVDTKGKDYNDHGVHYEKTMQALLHIDNVDAATLRQARDQMNNYCTDGIAVDCPRGGKPTIVVTGNMKQVRNALQVAYLRKNANSATDCSL